MRERGLVAALSLVLATMVILGVLAATTPETTDYLCFWARPRLVLEGGDPYAQAEWNSVTGGVWVDALGRTRPSNCSDRFAYPYPLTTALAMLPLGALPLYVGAAIWELSSSCRSSTPPVATLTSSSSRAHATAAAESSKPSTCHPAS